MLDKSKLEVFYPGKYTVEEQAAIDKLKADGTGAKFFSPEMGGDTLGPISRTWAQVYAMGYDRYNKIWYDTEYAQSMGFKDTPVRPGYVAAEFMAMMPRDVMGIGAAGTGDLVGDAYDQEVYYYKPIYPGDTLTFTDRVDDVYDATDPNGSTTRKLILNSSCDVYNQDGEKVARFHYRYPAFYIRSIDPDYVPETPHPFNRYLHPIHKYTQEDREQIKQWILAEKCREEVLYWEDVNVGDIPEQICEGPITQANMMLFHGVPLLENGNLRNYYERGHGPWGMYNPETGIDGNGLCTHIATANAAFYNFTSRNLGVRLVSNWMGPKGHIVKCAWRLVNDDENQVNHMPEDWYRPSYLLKVPFLKDAGRYCNIHGFCGDLGLMKGYVSDKYIDENGDHMVELVCWGEAMNGDIWSENLFTVKLPSKEA